MKVDKFGLEAGGNRVHKPSESYKGQVPRCEEPCAQHTGFDPSDQYADIECEKTHRGDWYAKYFNTCDPKKGGAYENISWLGNGFIQAPGGEQIDMYNGTRNKACKQGEISTVPKNKDDAVYAGLRSEVGNDGNQKNLPWTGGGGSSAYAGNRCTWTSGTTTDGIAQARGGYHLNKWTQNAEGGIGLGVNKGSDMKIYQRMEPDGTWHLQVKPSGDEGGNAVIKITPDGAIHITTKSTITVESKGTHTIKAPLLKIDAPVECTKTIEADHSMTSPNFHGCADRAKGPC